MRHTFHSLTQCNERQFDPGRVLKIAQGIKLTPGTTQIIVICQVHKIIDRVRDNESDVDCIVIDPRQENIVTVTGFRISQLLRKNDGAVKVVRLPRPIDIRIH